MRSDPSANGPPLAPDRAVAAVTIAAFLLAAIAAWLFAITTSRWGLIHDAANQFYVAWLTSQGLVPYRDIVEINWPGSFFLHRAFATLGAEHDLAWRLLDLALIAAAAAMVAHLARPAGVLAAAVAALLVAVGHLMSGPQNLVQRDHIIGVLVLVAVIALRGGVPRTLAAGVAIGAAATLKPLIGILPLAALYLSVDGWRRAGARVALAAVVAAIVLAMPLVYLLIHGAFDEFVAQQIYALRGYAYARPRHWFNALADFAIVRAPFLPLVLAGLLARAPVFAAPRRAAIVLIAYGAFHYLAQGKGFYYHALPLLYGLSLAAGLGVQVLLDTRRAVLRYLPAIMLVLLAVLCGSTVRELARTGWPSQTAAIVADLTPHLRSGDRVQPFDTTSGANDALRRMRVLPATRVLYDFLFFPGPVGAADGARLRAEFLAALAAEPPRAIVMTNQQWPELSRGYERLQAWPELMAFLETRYVLVVERRTVLDWGYRLYLRREP